MARHTREDVEAEVRALSDLPRDQLVARWTAIYSCPPPPGVRNALLARAVAWHLQARHLGGHSSETRRLLKAAIADLERKRTAKTASVGGSAAAGGGGSAAGSGSSAAGGNAGSSNAVAQPSARQTKILRPGARLLRD